MSFHILNMTHPSSHSILQYYWLFSPLLKTQQCVLFPSPRRSLLFHLLVCVLVCLSICQKDYRRTTGPIFMKIGDSTAQGRKHWMLEWIQTTGQIHKLWLTFTKWVGFSFWFAPPPWLKRAAVIEQAGQWSEGVELGITKLNKMLFTGSFTVVTFYSTFLQEGGLRRAHQTHRSTCSSLYIHDTGRTKERHNVPCCVSCL